MPIVASTPAPRLLNADEIGTMQAEQRVMGVPTKRPRSAPLTPPVENAGTIRLGKRKTSVAPATRKAKPIPTATSRKYVSVKFHHLVRKPAFSAYSTQNP